MIKSLKQYLLVEGILERKIVKIALTHRSAGSENNERMEFLGDSILGFIIAHILYESLPHADEGDLSRVRASLVNRRTLAKLSNSMNFSELIILGDGESKNGGCHRDSILADSFEAIIAAIYLINGLQKTQDYIRAVYKHLLHVLPDPKALKDPKSALQELLQERNLSLPEYALVTVAGKQHQRVFTVSCLVSDLDLTTQGCGESHRNAEQEAAKNMLPLITQKNGG